MKRDWLKDSPWETAVTINAVLCQEMKALHKPTSDSYEPAKKLWEKSRGRELTLRETSAPIKFNYYSTTAGSLTTLY